MESEKLKNRKTNIILIIVGGVLTLFIIPTFINYIVTGAEIFSSVPRYLKNISYGVSIGLLFWLGNWTVGSLTGRKLNWDKNLNQANFIALLSFILYGIIVSILFPYVVHKYLFHQTGQTLKSNVAYNAFFALSIDLIIISIYYSRYLVFYWKKALKKYEETKRAHLEAKYEALKNQVNPHFLFNSLNTLTGIVEQEPEKAVDFIKKLSDIYRYVLEQRDKELVTLREEMDFVENYIFLAKMRHGEGFKVTIDIEFPQKYILPLGIQMLVENSIKHNIISDNMPLNIFIKSDDKYVVVENNLQRKKIIGTKSPIGLENLKKRYEYLSQETVEVKEDENSFIVKVPIIKSSDELYNN